uniref:(northern house mosquito) hypothetical protein n=1 Tax=Culex pipiens TaxID=7175 RepID=A0A8D8I0V2_CULPI
MGQTNSLGLSLGAWIQINRVQKTHSQICSQPDNTQQSSSNNDKLITVKNIKDVMGSSLALQRIVKCKLEVAEPVPLIKKEKNRICRILCEHFFTELKMSKKTITTQSKKELAIKICEAYPILKWDKMDRPAEAEWFWEHNGESRGPHTGFIQSWCKNQSGEKDPTNKRAASCSLDVMEEIDELDNIIDENEANLTRIIELMNSTFSYRDKVRRKSKHNLFDVEGFKFLMKFEGKLIFREFDLIFPTERKSFTSIAPFCMMINDFYENVNFYEIKCMMKIIKYLTQQGKKTAQADPSLSMEEDMVADVVRWTNEKNPTVELFLEQTMIEHPFILCNARAMNCGDYHIVVNKRSLTISRVFSDALDLLLKAYTVLNFNVPPRFSKTFEFLNVILLKTKKCSHIKKVDALIQKIESSQPHQD